MAVLVAALLPSPSVSAEATDPTWPCIQRKQPKLSPGALWAGPPLDETLGDWRDDERAAQLVPALAVRRTSLEEAEALIAGFAEGLAEDRNRRLSLLFAGVFEHIDRERSEIIAGIGRYARKQAELASALDGTRDRLAALAAVDNPDFDQQDKLEELQDKLAWDTRIYRERNDALTYVCESPVLLEQRAFALARLIMAQLE